MFSRTIALFCLAIVCRASQGATITVTNNDDSGTGSLRDAIANATSGDTINFSSSGLTGGQTITLTTGALSPAVNVTITGDGSPAVTIASTTTRVFDFTTATLTAGTLDQLTINGAASDTVIGGAIRLAVGTAGSFTLTITKCNITGSSNNSGGAIGFNSANNNVSISDCTITGTNNSTSGNQNLTRGGALYFAGGTNSVSNSTIVGTCNGSGGGFSIQGGTTTFTNCTITNSSAGNSGGGAHGLSGTLIMINCTVAGNSAPSGAGIAQATATINLTNTIVANNGSADTSGTIASATNCLIENKAGTAVTTDTNNIFSTDPSLGTLQNNGGLTSTIALIPTSTPGLNPAYGQGTATGTPTTDQRGKSRPSPPSIGAFEPQAPVVTCPDLTVAVNTALNSINVGSFVSFGASDSTFTAFINWNDGSGVLLITATPGAAASVQGTVNGTLKASHTFSSTGSHTVDVLMNDPNGRAGTTQFNVTVINPPTASLSSAPAVDNSSNASSYSLSVQYSSAAAIDVSTLDGSDILVSGPNGFSASAAFSNVTPAGNGSPRTATYTLTPPGGTWTEDDNGTYTIALQAGSVGDTAFGLTAAQTLGTFTVTVFAPPVATLLAAPAVDNSSNANSYSLRVEYASSAAIDVSTLDGSDILVTGPNDFSQPAAFSNVSPIGNGSPRTATYTLTPPNGSWTAGANGTYTIALQGGSVGDTVGGTAAAKTLGTFSVGILTFNSAATATPNTAGVGQSVTFTAAATLSGSSIAWEFGDGSSGAGNSAAHAYASEGTYTATATASLNALSVTSSVSVTVKAPVVGEGNDSDGDGFSDTFESTLKTDPNDSASAPFALGASPPINTVKGKFGAKLNFAAPSVDTMMISGTFPVAANVQVASSTVGVTLGSFTAGFNFDTKGKPVGSPATRKVTLKINKAKNGASPTATITLKVNKENLQAALAPFGLTNTTVKSVPITVNALIVFGGALNQIQVSEHYAATEKKSGKTAK